ncbi:V-type ATPase subunit subunit G family protein [Methanogenium organophilum]|uniref:ATP synthase archaeal subunit H n=1 Tax=Methanogenium organophilum TaxID=2199 RepID=A0A9X9S466_METOG|nr:V-type ATPase subunit subunit G family protein [Methanogenium organophilum]WAI01664.1 hypothetical protein OU421_01990 [Methanogenium organophilum]
MTAGDIKTRGVCVPFEEIIRIREAEAAALAEIERARTEADNRIRKAHADAQTKEAAARERAGAEAAVHIAAVEQEAAAEAESIRAAAEEEIVAIRDVTDKRIDEAITYVVREVTGHDQTR